jgi:hypothetical protein
MLETYLGDSKSKFHPVTCHEGTDGEYGYSFALYLILAVDGMGG